MSGYICPVFVKRKKRSAYGFIFKKDPFKLLCSCCGSSPMWFTPPYICVCRILCSYFPQLTCRSCLCVLDNIVPACLCPLVPCCSCLCPLWRASSSHSSLYAYQCPVTHVLRSSPASHAKAVVFLSVGTPPPGGTSESRYTCLRFHSIVLNCSEVLSSLHQGEH